MNVLHYMISPFPPPHPPKNVIFWFLSFRKNAIKCVTCMWVLCFSLLQMKSRVSHVCAYIFLLLWKLNQGHHTCVIAFFCFCENETKGITRVWLRNSMAFHQQSIGWTPQRKKGGTPTPAGPACVITAATNWASVLQQTIQGCRKKRKSWRLAEVQHWPTRAWEILGFLWEKWIEKNRFPEVWQQSRSYDA